MFVAYTYILKNYSKIYYENLSNYVYIDGKKVYKNSCKYLKKYGYQIQSKLAVTRIYRSNYFTSL